MPALAVAEIVGGGLALAEGAAGFAAIAAVGAVAAGVGALTGDSDLAKIGSVVGVIGGVGMAANSMGLLGPATETAVPGAEATAGAEAAGEQAATGAGQQASATAQEATAGVVDTGAPTADTIGKAVTKVEPVPAAIETADAALPSQAEVARMTAAQRSPLETLKQFLDPALKFAKDNQMLTYGMMQVGGNFVSGLLDPTKPAQIKALDARANAEQAQAGLLNSRMANMNQPAPVATPTVPVRPNVYVTGRPAPTYTPPKVGLINTAVTGGV